MQEWEYYGYDSQKDFEEQNLMSDAHAQHFWGTMEPWRFAWYLENEGKCLSAKERDILRSNIVGFRRAWMQRQGKDLEEYFENGNIPDNDFFRKADTQG